MQKVVNYSKVSAIIQGPEENPMAFLDRLQEAIEKYTTADLKSCEGQVVLKDKFLTQAAPDIRRKLQKTLPPLWTIWWLPLILFSITELLSSRVRLGRRNGGSKLGMPG